MLVAGDEGLIISQRCLTWLDSNGRRVQPNSADLRQTRRLFHPVFAQSQNAIKDFQNNGIAFANADASV